MIFMIINLKALNKYKMDNICSFCSKEFSCKASLLNHQKTVKSCLILQGKQEEKIDCENCKKVLSIRSYRQHKLKCDLIVKKISEIIKKDDPFIEKEKENSNLLIIIDKQKSEIKERDLSIEKFKSDIIYLEKENGKLKSLNELLEKQNEKLQSISTSVTMKLAEKVNTVNTVNNKTVVINTSQLTNDVLRQCATTFTIDNAYNIDGITKHLTSSLEEHIICTDPSRNVFKYTNEKDEEIVDKDLDILLPQYLTALKDRNNFLYKEVYDYFKKNKVPLNEQTDYAVFYQALNNIIEQKGQQSKYTEKCKQHMVRECKRRFLEKNKNKDKTLTKKLTTEEMMINIIETGGSVTDFIKIMFPAFLDDDTDETEEECKHRREMEDMFIKKKREWRDKMKEIKEMKINKEE
jgi:hypothetical protein